VSGPIEVVLFVSSDCPDTDFTAKLVDVYPDGRAFNLVEGITRMRYRHDVTAPAPMRPGEIYRISIDLDSTSNWFGPGHRIRLEISSSNFPRFDRNLNTGADNAATADYKIAHNAVHMGGNYRSRLILPIVKGP
ncbi:MAG: CocE/NonD family hydrolase, partial [Sphingomonadales bacterium]|nr:CocE/NonD family hydrolase [Sphingomonadales bacterium]